MDNVSTERVSADLELTRGLTIQMLAIGTLGMLVGWTLSRGHSQVTTGSAVPSQSLLAYGEYRDLVLIGPVHDIKQSPNPCNQSTAGDPPRPDSQMSSELLQDDDLSGSTTRFEILKGRWRLVQAIPSIDDGLYITGFHEANHEF